jgi:lipoate-protein ligase B
VSGSPYLEVRRLGSTTYVETLALQEALVEERAAGEVGDVLILTEHEPVLTVGRGGAGQDLSHVGAPVHEVERGGEATWHGPGQVVAYPILHLAEDRRDLHQYLRDLEEVVIGVLGEFEVEGVRRAEGTGVWIGEQKICSIGVGVRHWVTFHGVAINVHTDLDVFTGFRPCGLDPEVMTRLSDHVDVPEGNLLVEVLFVKHLCRVFGLELPPVPEPDVPDNGFPGLPLHPSSQ